MQKQVYMLSNFPIKCFDFDIYFAFVLCRLTEKPQEQPCSEAIVAF